MGYGLDVSGFDLRPVRAEDYEALARLAISSSDTGAVRVAPRYLQNPVEANAALRPDVQWVVAESEDGLVGAAQMAVGETEVEGGRYPVRSPVRLSEGRLIAPP